MGKQAKSTKKIGKNLPKVIAKRKEVQKKKAKVKKIEDRKKRRVAKYKAKQEEELALKEQEKQNILRNKEEDNIAQKAPKNLADYFDKIIFPEDDSEDNQQQIDLQNGRKLLERWEEEVSTLFKEGETITAEEIHTWTSNFASSSVKDLDVFKKILGAFHYACHDDNYSFEDDEFTNDDSNQVVDDDDDDNDGNDNEETNFEDENIDMDYEENSDDMDEDSDKVSRTKKQKRKSSGSSSGNGSDDDEGEETHSFFASQESFQEIIRTGFGELLDFFNELLGIQNEIFDDQINEGEVFSDDDDEGEEEIDFEETENKNAKNKKNKKINKKNAKRKRVMSPQFTITNSEKFKKHNYLLFSFLNDIIFFLDKVNDQHQQNAFTFVLPFISSNQFLHYIAVFPLLSKKLLKSATNMMECANERNSLFLFLILQKTAVLYPFPFVDFSLEAAYLNYLKMEQRTVNRKKKRIVVNIMIELIQVDFKSSYTFCYSKIRNLAFRLHEFLLNLHNANSDAEKMKIRKRYLESNFEKEVTLFSRVICSYPTVTELIPIVYPLLQLIETAIREIRVATEFSLYLPLYLRLVELELNIAQSTGVFVTVVSALLSILQTEVIVNTALAKSRFGQIHVNDVQKKKIDWKNDIAASISLLIVSHTRNDIVRKISDLLLRYYYLYHCSIAFPELAATTILILKQFIKSEKSKKFAVQFKPLRELLDTLENNTNFINSHRRKVDMAPKEYEKVDAFLSVQKANGSSPLAKLYFKKQKLPQVESTLPEDDNGNDVSDEEEDQQNGEDEIEVEELYSSDEY